MTKLNLYPDFFPAGCPPIDALEAELDVYRYIKSSTIDESDFKSYYEINPAKWEGNIQAYALSVNFSYESAKNDLDLNPFLRKKFRSIAVGKLNKEAGVIKKTPSKTSKNHMSWWMCKNFNPVENFKICDC